jgi:putative ABC transport system substrate-binding protein
MARLAKKIAAVAILLIVSASLSAKEKIAVVYPVVREPFSSIYRDFLAGIKSGYPGEVVEYPVNGIEGEKLSRELSKNDAPKAFIALGTKSLNFILASKVDKPVFAAVTKLNTRQVVAGGVLLKPGAEVYLDRLMEIAPNTSRIHVVYNPEIHRELIAQAAAYLNKSNIEFHAVAATDIRKAALGFRKIVEGASHGDAVWLISDSGLIDESLLSLVLDAAWDKHLAVFSSNPLFVKRGALFAIYPDNVVIGIRLGNMVEKALSGKQKATLMSLRDVKIAFNERTGNHIGIKLSSKTRENVDLFLPEP